MKATIDVGRKIIFIIAIMIIVGFCIGFILHIKPVVVVSGSMEPTIETGSFLLVNENDKDIKENDIIAFKRENMLVAHRVIAITHEGYITKGDANDTVDIGILKDDAVNGTVLFWIPKIGYILKWVSSFPGLIAIISVCIVIVFTNFLIGREMPYGDSEK